MSTHMSVIAPCLWLVPVKDRRGLDLIELELHVLLSRLWMWGAECTFIQWREQARVSFPLKHLSIIYFMFFKKFQCLLLVVHKLLF